MPLIQYLRDNFDSPARADAWGASYAIGSATVAQTGGQARITLPISTAGAHEGGYRTSARYNLTADGVYINIDTMVSSSAGSVAYAQFVLFVDSVNLISWIQTSGTLKAQKTIAGVVTDLYSVTWDPAAYKYLRMREASGTTYWDSSTNGTSWTNRASAANPFAVTGLYLQLIAGCGNVASPGSFRIEQVNTILPALSSTWHWTQVEWTLLYRFKTITLASSATGQGYIATSSDGTTWTYYSGPIGSASGNYNQLTAQSTQAAAQAMAVNLPANDRWDLPTIIECRYIRLYHRSISGTTYRIDEYYPRRLVQSDDVEAESIRAINIGAGAITADKIFALSITALQIAAGAITADKINVVNLQAVSAQMGALHMDGVIDIAAAGGIYQGSGSFASPTTGLKLFNSSGVGKLSGYNAGVEQITLDTDGKLKAGAGSVLLDVRGVGLKATTSGVVSTTAALSWYDATFATTQAYVWADSAAGNQALYLVSQRNAGGTKFGTVQITAQGTAADAEIIMNGALSGGSYLSLSAATLQLLGGVNVGIATGAAGGQIATSGSVGIGVTPAATARLAVRGQGATAATTAIYLDNSAATALFYVLNDSSAFVGGNTGIGIAPAATARLYVRGAGATSATTAIYIDNSSATATFYIQNDGDFYLGASGSQGGFFGSTGATKPTVTGSRGANAALASLLTSLASLGLLVDSST